MVAPYSWYESLVIAYSWKSFYKNENGQPTALEIKVTQDRADAPEWGAGTQTPP